MTTTYNVGWDIGGAHVKAAVLNPDGKLLATYQQPCPLWQGLAHLQSAVQAILQHLESARHCHAITMTGELVDLFACRADGVRHILDTMKKLLPNTGLTVFAGTAGLLPIGQISAQHYPAIASSNWLASAQIAAQQCRNGLLVDIGSTTTDILLLKDGQVLAEAYSDYGRLISRELVYTGIIRTPVMAIAQTVADNGLEVPLMAEYFATMADVYRLTGELDEAHDQTAPADNGEKTLLASARRLARMLGCDFESTDLPRWQAVAQYLRLQQLQTLEQACELQLSRLPLPNHSPMIGAGVGRFLVKELARHLRYPYRDFADLLPAPLTATPLNAADCAPAVAVACLAYGWRAD